MFYDSYEIDSDNIDYPELAEIYTSDEDEMEFRLRNSDSTYRRERQVINSQCLQANIRLPKFETKYKSLKTKTYEKKNVKVHTKDTICPICIDILDLQNSRSLVFCSSQCGHLYHRQCIILLLYKNSRRKPKFKTLPIKNFIKCPTCRCKSTFKRPKQLTV